MHFERPTVVIIQHQEVETQEVKVDAYEAQSLLAKYGHSINEPQAQPIEDDGLTFEELVKRERSKNEANAIRKVKKDYGPKPITFSGSNYSSDVKYQSDDELGINFRIEITTNMNLPK